MICNNCGLMNEHGNCFCVRCGAPIAPDTEPQDYSAEKPAQRKYDDFEKEPRERKVNKPALFMGILNVLLAAIIVLMATGITGAVLAPQHSSFALPEDAVKYFMSHVKEGDYEGALAACAVKNASENIDYEAMTEWQEMVMPSWQMLPSEYGLYKYSNEAYMKNSIMKQLCYMAMSVTLPADYAGVLNGYIIDGDTVDLSSITGDMDPSKFSDIEIVQIGEYAAGGDDTKGYYNKKLAEVYGADEAAALPVLYKAGEGYYAGGVTLLKYGKDWMIFSLSDFSLRQPENGALIPLKDKSDFGDWVGGDYTSEETAPAATPSETTAPTETVMAGGVINLYSFTDEVPKMLDKYKQLHPEFPYELNVTIIPTTDGLYEPALDEALLSGQADMYCVAAEFAAKYTKGEMSDFAIPYDDLGINTAAEMTAADIAPYIAEVGTRTEDNKIVGLGYQSTAGVIIYRRSIAKNVWGTDDPAVIKTKLGPGWNKFFDAAADLNKKGFAIVSGCGDIWHAVEKSAEKGWIVDGKLYLDPSREAYLDYCKELIQRGYTNDTMDWTEGWYNDMAANGEKPVFGFFGPAWFINYILPGNCGGSRPGEGTYGDWAVCEPPAGFFWGGTWVLASKTLEGDPEKKAAVAELVDWITLQCGEDSFQYAWANGTVYNPGVKDAVASGTVMGMSDGTLDLLDGQNMFDALRPASDMASGGNITVYDDIISNIWRDKVRQYAHGDITRNQAIEDFKRAVRDQLGINAW